MTLRAAGFDLSSRTVEAVCRDGAVPSTSSTATPTHSMELGVEIAKVSAATASSRAILIRYSIGGERRELRWPFGVMLCRPGLSDYVHQC